MPFKIDFLDHVSLRVKDLQASVAWYEKVLGLKKIQPPEWGEFPIFMMSGKTGIALFPAKLDDPKLEAKSKNIKIDHFAFNVTNNDFQKAIKHYDTLSIEYNIQDHHYFHSIYTKDPDGHTVELTTLVKDANDIYPEVSS